MSETLLHPAAPGAPTLPAVQAAPAAFAAPTLSAPSAAPDPATGSSAFFARRRPGRPGLALFLNAGDPPLELLPELLAMLDESEVDCLELAVPFPDSVTDGPVVRRSANRALARGVTADAVLAVVAAVRPSLRHLRIALLADWSHTVKGTPLPDFTRKAADAGCDGLLLHGLPPRLREAHHDSAREAGLPVVTTCYAVSGPLVQADAAARAGAYLYLVAHYGRSGTDAPLDERRLAETVHRLQETAAAPVAVGFGVRTARDIARLEELGVQSVVVGSAGVARVEDALAHRRDPVGEFAEFVRELRGTAPAGSTPTAQKGTTS
ncbi:tryptophan synthase subunit alpha [Streptomyces sp. bgisy126]|uniref:tryptophan synthase subunit alpha n=1 Tax=unclassified Streptomyces TaxID=2593676 RepID=UPI003EBFD162